MLIRFVVFICLCLISVTGCRQSNPSSGIKTSKIQVITTLFPLYDMARAVGGNKADVRLLVPPGVEPHNFEPRPDDIITINKASLFIYTNRFMEPWAERLLSGVASERIRIVDASAGLMLHPPSPGFHDEHDHKDSGTESKNHGSGMDPHVWLDLGNAVKMVNTILAGFVARDPVNRSYYEANASAYSSRLQEMDRRYYTALETCSSRNFLHAGHYTFGYLARRYRLDYLAATGVTGDSEPTPARMAALVKQVRNLGIKVVFAEELVSPKLAETLAGETGAEIVKLHAGHNVSREELSGGVTFPDLMEQNLAALTKGLQCHQP